MGWPFGPLFKLLLLTAQRRDEVGGMRWSELDLSKRTWTIPRERAKSDRAHIVQFSRAGDRDHRGVAANRRSRFLLDRRDGGIGLQPSEGAP